MIYLNFKKFFNLCPLIISMKKFKIYFPRYKIHILFPLSVSFVLGIIWQDIQFSWPLATVIVIGFYLGLLLFCKQTTSKILYALILCIASFFCGALLLKHQINKQEQFYQETHNKYFDVTAIVENIYAIKNHRLPIALILSIQTIKRSGQSQDWKPLNKTIQCYTQNVSEIQIKDKIQIKNLKFKKPNNKLFSKYLLKQKIALSLFVNHITFTLLDRPNISLSRWLFNKRKTIFHDIQKKMSKFAFVMFASIFLGEKNNTKTETESIKAHFKSWGTLHFLARSGLHLVIFILIFEFCLKFIPLYFLWKQLIIIIISTLYLLLSWSSIPFTRAFYAFILQRACPFLNTKAHTLYLVTLVGICMLIYNPIQLFSLDFQLSFCLTITLVLYSQIKATTKIKKTL